MAPRKDDPEKHCIIEGCGKLLVRNSDTASPQYESPWKFRRRLTCGGVCKHVHQAMNRRANATAVAEIGRFCEAPGCAKPIVRRPNEIMANFRTRTHCNGSCAQKGEPVEPRACPWCETVFTPPATQRSQRYCSQSCAGKGSARELFGVTRSTQRPTCMSRFFCDEPAAPSAKGGWRKFCSDACRAQNMPVHRSIRSSDLKPCRWCGETIEPEAGEPPSLYNKRIYCDQTCFGAAYRAGALTRMSYVLKERAGIPEKICATCEKPLPIGDLKPAMYLRRHHCDACVPIAMGKAARARAAAMVKDLGARVCEICQGEFIRRDGETVGNFKIRRTCENRACRAEVRSRSRIGKLGKPRVEFQKTCVACEVTFSRRQGETAGNFRKRIACSLACGRVLAKRTKTAHHGAGRCA